MFKLNKFVIFITLVSTLFSGNLILPTQAQENQADLEYLNQDLSETDQVFLRPSEAEVDKGYSVFGDGSITKYDPVVDIKTCTKKEIYRFFYRIVDNAGSFDNFTTSN